MKKTNVTFTFILVLAVLFFAVFRKWREPALKEAFDRTPSQLQYTRHAQCRMSCRQISKQDISDVLEKGVINLNKSNKGDRPCPTFAMQGRTNDGQYIRVIFAQCSEETKVVTCYDLEQDFKCNCPGD